ncbi:GTPase-activating protein S23, partial [Coelomomyces lativittatus]
MPQHTTIEYTLARPASTPPIFMMVIDTCLEDPDLTALKNTVLSSFTILPPHALVGVVTFGTM